MKNDSHSDITNSEAESQVKAVDAFLEDEEYKKINNK